MSKVSELNSAILGLISRVKELEGSVNSHSTRLFNLEKRMPKATTQEMTVGVDNGYHMRLDQLLGIIALLNMGQFINAIKEMRTLFPNMSLKEAKEIVEGIRAQLTFSIAKSFSS